MLNWQTNRVWEINVPMFSTLTLFKGKKIWNSTFIRTYSYKKISYFTCLLTPDGTRTSVLLPIVALILGQKFGPDLILGPTRFTPVTKMSFLQFSAVSWVHLWPSTHQSHGKGDETQDVQDEKVLQSKNVKLVETKSGPSVILKFDNFLHDKVELVYPSIWNLPDRQFGSEVMFCGSYEWQEVISWSCTTHSTCCPEMNCNFKCK